MTVKEEEEGEMGDNVRSEGERRYGNVLYW